MNPPVRAYVGLGGNLGDVETTLTEAMWALDSLPQTSIRAQSAFYRTPPWGNTQQPAFLNAVVELQTRMAPRVLLDLLLEIEGRFGRDRSEGARANSTWTCWYTARNNSTSPACTCRIRTCTNVPSCWCRSRRSRRSWRYRASASCRNCLRASMPRASSRSSRGKPCTVDRGSPARARR
jgi:2-amino-4-hydroxy-6-hydroxymethyldihydropteridine diphosphokinase